MPGIEPRFLGRIARSLVVIHQVLYFLWYNNVSNKNCFIIKFFTSGTGIMKFGEHDGHWTRMSVLLIKRIQVYSFITFIFCL
jgi:hypothetical protein